MPWMTDYGFLGTAFGGFWILVIIDLVLKGFALWRSARNNQMYWFIALLIVNSLGILPLIYLIVVDKNYLFKDLQKRLH